MIFLCKFYRHWRIKKQHAFIEEGKKRCLIKKRWNPEVIDYWKILQEAYLEKPEVKKYIVFIDHSMTLNFQMRGTMPSQGDRLISEILALANLPCDCLWKGQKIAFLTMCGSALSAALDNYYDQACNLKTSAEKFRTERMDECSRKWTMRFSAIALGALAASWWIFQNLNWLSWTKSPFWFAFFSGFAGAYLSIVRKAGKARLDSASGWGIHLLLVLSKLLTGGGFGIVAYLLLMCPPLCPPLFAQMGESVQGIALTAFIAGFCEYFVPNIISQKTTPQNNKEAEK